jgi:hypothetical protein
MNCLKPRPSSPPSTDVAGVRKPSNTSSVDSTPLYPSFLSGREIVRPGCSWTPGAFSRMSAVIPRCGGSASGSVFARSMTPLERSPFVAHIFCPVITYSSPSRTARVRIAWTSDPACGSVIEYAKWSSPVAMRGR